MASPEPSILISCLYLVTIWLLNRIMRDRAPLQLRLIAIVHNAALIGLSAYMAVEIFRNAFIANRYHFICNRVDRTDAGLPMARVLYIFYLSKAYEFIDTFLMCFRKKTAQISFLHVYHHFMTFVLWWFGIKFTPGGDAYFSAMLNSAVHVIMYSYYLCTALGVRFPFKKLITQAQLAQFAAIIFHCFAGLYYGCHDVNDNFSPAWMHVSNTAYMLSFIILFGMFYNDSYVKRDDRAKRE